MITRPKICLMAALLGLSLAAQAAEDNTRHTHSLRSPDYSDGLTLAHAGKAMHSPPLLAKLMVDELEATHSQGNDGVNWDISSWYGSALNRLWLKTEGERSADSRVDANIEALFSHAIAPFWDVQIGARHDLARDGKPNRNWGSIGLQGIAPYWFELEATAYVGNDSRSAARLKVSYELRVTQKLILEPEIETWLYGKDDRERSIGKGLASLDSGLRLRYEITRRFAPYIGVNRSWLFDDTRAQAHASSENTASTQWVAGIRLWY